MGLFSSKKETQPISNTTPNTSTTANTANTATTPMTSSTTENPSSMIIDEAVPPSINIPGPTTAAIGKHPHSTSHSGGVTSGVESKLAHADLKKEEYKYDAKEAMRDNSSSSKSKGGILGTGIGASKDSTNYDSSSHHHNHDHDHLTHHSGEEHIPSRSFHPESGTTGAYVNPDDYSSGRDTTRVGTLPSHGLSHSERPLESAKYEREPVMSSTVPSTSHGAYTQQQPSIVPSSNVSSMAPSTVPQGYSATSPAYGSTTTPSTTHGTSYDTPSTAIGTTSSYPSNTTTKTSSLPGTAAAAGATAAGIGAAHSHHSNTHSSNPEYSTKDTKDTKEDMSLTEKIKDKLHIGSSKEEPKSYSSSNTHDSTHPTTGITGTTGAYNTSSTGVPGSTAPRDLNTPTSAKLASGAGVGATMGAEKFGADKNLSNQVGSGTTSAINDYSQNRGAAGSAYPSGTNYQSGTIGDTTATSGSYPSETRNTATGSYPFESTTRSTHPTSGLRDTLAGESSYPSSTGTHDHHHDHHHNNHHNHGIEKVGLAAGAAAAAASPEHNKHRDVTTGISGTPSHHEYERSVPSTHLSSTTTNPSGNLSYEIPGGYPSEQTGAPKSSAYNTSSTIPSSATYNTSSGIPSSTTSRQAGVPSSNTYESSSIPSQSYGSTAPTTGTTGQYHPTQSKLHHGAEAATGAALGAAAGAGLAGRDHAHNQHLNAQIGSKTTPTGETILTTTAAHSGLSSDVDKEYRNRNVDHSDKDHSSKHHLGKSENDTVSGKYELVAEPEQAVSGKFNIIEDEYSNRDLAKPGYSGQPELSDKFPQQHGYTTTGPMRTDSEVSYPGIEGTPVTGSTNTHSTFAPASRGLQSGPENDSTRSLSSKADPSSANYATSATSAYAPSSTMSARDSSAIKEHSSRPETVLPSRTTGAQQQYPEPTHSSHNSHNHFNTGSALAGAGIAGAEALHGNHTNKSHMPGSTGAYSSTQPQTSAAYSSTQPRAGEYSSTQPQTSAAYSSTQPRAGEHSSTQSKSLLDKGRELLSSTTHSSDHHHTPTSDHHHHTSTSDHVHHTPTSDHHHHTPTSAIAGTAAGLGAGAAGSTPSNYSTNTPGSSHTHTSGDASEYLTPEQQKQVRQHFDEVNKHRGPGEEKIEGVLVVPIPASEMQEALNTPRSQLTEKFLKEDSMPSGHHHHGTQKTENSVPSYPSQSNTTTSTYK